MKSVLFVLFAPFVMSCSPAAQSNTELTENSEIVTDTVVTPKPLFCNETVKVGAERFDGYLPKIEGKKVAIVGNQSSMTGDIHLVDALMEKGINVVKVFSPEHGFRGDADAGEKVKDGIDPKTGLPVISLYGNNKKPTAAQLKDVEVILFDIQDVGARFYTYISTLHYVMEAAAENDKKVIVLDRPNPNGHYVDGPVLKDGFDSFVGMHKVPVVHGMTVAEYARMINEEGWLKNNVKADLDWVSCEGWDHNEFYEVPIAPSPNLPNMKAIYWYPSLCFFEGTVVSIGRGTDIPFQCVGHPKFEVDILEDLYSFKPAPNGGAAHPKLEGETCYGYDLSKWEIEKIREQRMLNLDYLQEFYKKLGSKSDFFLSTNFIDLLYGSDQLRKDLLAGKSVDDIRLTWTNDLEAFKEIRKKYLIYQDFE
ncbi:MAG: DUF1343 domain-containing protein [Crocinitomicaceae bacterium]|nr:DUF1343 domain-containing protein [Crocinitomicaceae bacterium]